MGLAYSTYSNITGSAGIDPGRFVAFIGTSPENLGRAVGGLRREIARIVEEPVEIDELEMAKSYLTGSFVFKFQTNAQIASYLVEAEIFDLGFDFLERYPRLVGEGCPTLNVHAKVMIVDDLLVRVASSNLSNRSMGLDTELDLTLEAMDDARVGVLASGLRCRLLGEHLGVPAERVATAVERTGSLRRAIEELRGGDRTLEPLPPDEPGWLEQAMPANAVLDMLVKQAGGVVKYEEHAIIVKPAGSDPAPAPAKPAAEKTEE